MYFKNAVLGLIFFLFAFLSVSSAATETQSSPIIDYTWPFHPEYSKNGMVVSEDSLASQIGADILSQGGNAVDAAVAVGFSLAVTLPKAGNLAGGGFMLIHVNTGDKNIALDYREVAPLNASANMYLNQDGSVNNDSIRYTAKGTAVPGTVAGLVYAQQHYGRLKLSEVMKPAITIAEQGFPVTFALSQSLESRKERLLVCETSAKTFFKAGKKDYQPGDMMKRTDLANTLKIIAEKGNSGFYQGRIAELFVKGIKQHGGIISLEDLKQYRPIERDVLMGNYRGYQIATMPPPSSGGVHLIEMLNILENFPLAEWGPNRSKTIQIMVEAMRSAYADRSKYLGDPAFYKVPVTGLISKLYAKKLASEITLGKARNSNKLGPDNPIPYESPQTTHFSVIDSDGNMVSNTYTLNFSYGNGHTIAGTGIVLNNEMDDFSVKPGVANAYGLLGGEANSIKPGKRPLSSMTPTFIFKDGKPYAATGSPGGSTIITVVLETVVNLLDFNMNIAAASSWPRFHHQWFPDVVYTEPGISADTIENLQKMGYKIKEGRTLGSTQSIVVIDHNQYGSSDPRRTGGAAIAAKSGSKTIEHK